MDRKVVNTFSPFHAGASARLETLLAEVEELNSIYSKLVRTPSQQATVFFAILIDAAGQVWRTFRDPSLCLL